MKASNAREGSNAVASPASWRTRFVKLAVFGVQRTAERHKVVARVSVKVRIDWALALNPINVLIGSIFHFVFLLVWLGVAWVWLGCGWYALCGAGRCLLVFRPRAPHRLSASTGWFTGRNNFFVWKIDTLASKVADAVEDVRSAHRSDPVDEDGVCVGENPWGAPGRKTLTALPSQQRGSRSSKREKERATYAPSERASERASMALDEKTITLLRRLVTTIMKKHSWESLTINIIIQMIARKRLECASTLNENKMQFRTDVVDVCAKKYMSAKIKNRSA